MQPEFISQEIMVQVAGGDDEAVAQVWCARQSRERAYLSKQLGEAVEQSAWNPKKYHRKCTWVWLCQIDHMIKLSTGKTLKHFSQPEDVAERGPWHTWPLLSYAGDQGPKEECACHVLARKPECKINIDRVPDPSHGVWNDCKMALKASGHWNHTGLMMLTWNMKHGPFGEDKRQNEISGSMRQYFAHTKNPRDSPLFMSLLPRLIFDCQDESLNFRSNAEDLIWAKLKMENPYAAKGGSQCQLNRFMGYLKEAWKRAPTWTQEYMA